MKAVLEKIRSGQINAEPVAMITDNPEAGAIDIAKKFGIKPIVLPFKSYLPDKDAYHLDLKKKIVEVDPDLIVTAGYLRILKPDIVKLFKNKIINIHPSLLPAFPGLHSQKQALDYGVKITGCTTHFIDEGVDSGSIILQSAVMIAQGMTEAELSGKILKEEHRILCLAVKYFCEDKLKIAGRQVTVVA
jgi:phosphoribosylglycinamide formyltransferase 1